MKLVAVSLRQRAGINSWVSSVGVILRSAAMGQTPLSIYIFFSCQSFFGQHSPFIYNSGDGQLTSKMRQILSAALS
jgi:hypothetical protein